MGSGGSCATGGTPNACTGGIAGWTGSGATKAGATGGEKNAGIGGTAGRTADGATKAGANECDVPG